VAEGPDDAEPEKVDDPHTDERDREEVFEGRHARRTNARFFESPAARRKSLRAQKMLAGLVSFVMVISGFILRYRT
jgi:hypothetical protein